MLGTLPRVVITVPWWVLNVLCTTRILLSEFVMVVSVVCRGMPEMPESKRFRSPVMVPVMGVGVIT